MTHGFMWQIDPADPTHVHLWCLCSKWWTEHYVTVPLESPIDQTPFVYTEGADHYQQHARDVQLFGEPSAHKWIPSSDGIETCEHCDMMRAV